MDASTLKSPVIWINPDIDAKVSEDNKLIVKAGIVSAKKLKTVKLFVNGIEEPSLSAYENNSMDKSSFNESVDKKVALAKKNNEIIFVVETINGLVFTETKTVQVKGMAATLSMFKRNLVLSALLLGAFLISSCHKSNAQKRSKMDTRNTLTEKEKKDGWILLFDGKSLSNWKVYKKDSVGSGWKVEDGTLHFDGTKNGDIITKEQYQNFALQLEWKISNNGNSGIFYHVVEVPEYQQPMKRVLRCKFWMMKNIQMLKTELMATGKQVLCTT